jgi:uncharacterized protein YndB with AHSA1/START domain
MLKKIAIALGVVVLLVLAYAATRPDTFRIERTASIQAPPEKIYPLIADFRRWTAWSPFEELDPDMQRTYGDVAEGRGATYAWEGDSNAGAGRMEITEATPPQRILIDLHFLAPLEGRNLAEFTLEPAGGGTNVTWAMSGPSPFISKLIGVFVSMDAMIGGAFEAGLANLKRVAEQ